MTKKQIVKNYLLKHVDIQGLKVEYQNSWLINKPFNWIYHNGIIHKHFYNHSKKAIKKAAYKHPTSDRTWLTVLDVQKEIIDEYREYLTN